MDNGTDQKAGDTLNKSGHEIEPLRIDGQDKQGATVQNILGQSPTASVYTTADGQLRWRYTANKGNIPSELFPSISKFDSLMSEIRTYAPESHKEECYMLLGKALFAACNSVGSGHVENVFAETESYLHALVMQRSRTQYVFQCLVFAAFLTSVILVLVHYLSLVHEYYFYAAIFGGAGACISVMQRANTINIDWTLDKWGLALQAFIRVALGMIFGMIFMLACRYDFLLGAFKEQVGAVYLLALVAGFSERMIPDLFSRLEMAASEGDAS